jgi:2'-5' RNA ligase
MPRLFTGLEIPPDIADALSSHRGGLSGARWIDPSNYHITLRFIGDVDGATARDVLAILGESRARAPLAITVDALMAFGGSRPRALVARVAANPELARLQAEQERLMQRVGLDPESRKYTPHVTLARLRNPTSSDVAAYLAMRGQVPRLSFTASQFVLYSARDSVGGGPYVVEAAYPLGLPGEALAPAPSRERVAG